MAQKQTTKYVVLCEQNITNLRGNIEVQRLTRYYMTDSLSMAQSIAASLQRINHSWRIMENGKQHSQWLREGFCEK